MEIKERFLNYVSFDTQSDSYSHTVPSTSKQLKLGNYLVEELKSLGIENAKIDEFGVVYGTIPSNNNHQGDVIGFIAHMDTSPDASGKDIHPQIIKDYQGQKITLNEDKELYLDPEQYPQLLQLIHHDLITTDGTTLLGADDKAGIAIIMQWWNIFIIIQNLNIMIFKLLLHLMKKLDMVVITLMLITSMHNMLIPLMVEIFTLLNMKTLTHLVPK